MMLTSVLDTGVVPAKLAFRKPYCITLLRDGYCPLGYACFYSHDPGALGQEQRREVVLDTRGGSIQHYTYPDNIPKELPPSLVIPPPGGYEFTIPGSFSEWGWSND